MTSLFKLLRLKVKRRGLMRERRRLHQERNGIEWMLKQNEADAIAVERKIAELTEVGRREAWLKRYEVKS